MVYGTQITILITMGPHIVGNDSAKPIMLQWFISWLYIYTYGYIYND